MLDMHGIEGKYHRTGKSVLSYQFTGREIKQSVKTTVEVARIHEIFLGKRLRIKIEPQLLDFQSGFRKGHIIQDHIFTVIHIIEKILKHNTEV